MIVSPYISTLLLT